MLSGFKWLLSLLLTVAYSESDCSPNRLNHVYS